MIPTHSPDRPTASFHSSCFDGLTVERCGLDCLERQVSFERLEWKKSILARTTTQSRTMDAWSDRPCHVWS
jgi:hypothetical protein